MPISGLMVKVKLVVNIEKFKIMDYKKLLGDIINAIPQPTASNNKRGTNAEVCYEIQKAAIKVGYPFKLSGTSVFIPTPESIGSV